MLRPARLRSELLAKETTIRDAHYPGKAQVDAYGNGGFRFADMSHRGSIMMLPSGVYGWDMAEGEALTVEKFARVIDNPEGIEVLLVGTGQRLVPLPADLKAALKACGIASDPMSTGAAVRTYNIMQAEQRAVAAAFIAVEG